MSTVHELRSGRYLLLLDILGFSNLVETQGAEEIYATINDMLKACGKWEQLNGQFRTIYFSDTIIFYQEPKGYGNWAFLDIYAIGGMILSALLAKGIPARGAISFGEFEVRPDQSGKHQVYYGRALIEAHRAEQAENWIGISILKSAWIPYEEMNPKLILCFTHEGAWIRRHDDVLLLNPFIKMRSCHQSAQLGEITTPYLEWNAPEFPNEIRAFKFLHDQASECANRGDFTSRTAMKYHATILFLKQVMGNELYEWAKSISQTIASTASTKRQIV